MNKRNKINGWISMGISISLISITLWLLDKVS